MSREYEFDVTFLVTAKDKNDAYSQVSDSGISVGALIGTVRILSVSALEQTGAPEQEQKPEKKLPTPEEVRGILSPKRWEQEQKPTKKIHRQDNDPSLHPFEQEQKP